MMLLCYGVKEKTTPEEIRTLMNKIQGLFDDN